MVAFADKLKRRILEAHHRRGGFLSYAIALVLIGIALLTRLAMAPINAGLQYITFFPAVTLAVVIGGFWPGMLATIIGISLATFFFTPPFYSFSSAALQASFWSNMVFLMDGIIVCASIESMHRYRAGYAAELEEAKRQEARAVAINKSLDEFTCSVAHDLKEPLRGIHNYASFLKKDCATQLGETGLQYLNNIQRLAKRLSALIDSLMASSRLDTSELIRDTVDLDAVVDQATEDMRSLWDSIELRRNNLLGTVQGDATRIGEVFQNLISNAAKYNDKAEKWIEIGCKRNDSRQVFYVRDNGIGIPQQHHDNIFRIFKRLHEESKYGGGAGAGLAITRKIIERYGGSIWLESTPGEGSVFYFTLSGEEP